MSSERDREHQRRTDLKVVLQRRPRQEQPELDVEPHQGLIPRRLVVLELMTLIEHGHLPFRFVLAPEPPLVRA